jgi:pentatricopeptide repeat protein
MRNSGIIAQLQNHSKFVFTNVDQIYQRRGNAKREEELRRVRFGEGPEAVGENLEPIFQTLKKIKTLCTPNTSNAYNSNSNSNNYGSNFKPVVLDTGTYNQLLLMYAKMSFTKEALDLYAEMTRHVQPDAVTYNILLTIYAKADAAEEAIRVSRKMRQLDFEMEAHGCRALIDSFLSINKEHEAIELFQDMKEMFHTGSRAMQPQSKAGERVVMVGGKARDQQKNAPIQLTKEQQLAVPLFLEYFERVVDEHVLSKEFGQARGVLESLRQLGIKPSFGIYERLIRATAQAGKTKEVWHFFFFLFFFFFFFLLLLLLLLFLLLLCFSWSCIPTIDLLFTVRFWTFLIQ